MTQIHIRGAEFELRDDGRTLSGCIVPYGVVADIVELNAENQLERYREQFLPHSLAAMAQGFNARGGNTSKRSNCFIPLLIDHTDKFDSMIGHAVELEDRDTGAYASFRLYEDTNLVKIRSVLTESHQGLSVAFKDIRPPKTIDGVISRVQVHIGHVAATPSPAYVGAGIESLRQSNDVENERPLLDDVKAWLAAQRESASQ